MPEPKTTKILFLAQARYDTIPPETFHKGKVYALRADLAMRWVSRGSATDDAELIAAAENAARSVASPVASAETKIPANWKFLPAEKKADLAKLLGASEEQLADKDGINDFIGQAESARSAKA